MICDKSIILFSICFSEDTRNEIILALIKAKRYLLTRNLCTAIEQNLPVDAKMSYEYKQPVLVQFDYQLC